ncbi:MAG: leucine-rich repeat protein [Muribaculaceae bacterium]|nr:leucine-rich repeat protein [Muribaculaceae bacterium]
MKKFLLSIISAISLSAASYAYDLEINGVYFNIIDAENRYLEVVQGYNYSGIIILPESISYKGATYTVTSIGENAFFNCADLQYIELPNSIVTIGNNAFYGCTSLEEVFLPDSVATLGSSAFRDCSALEHIVIGTGVTEIPEWSFSSCSNLKEIVIPTSVTTISGQAFYGCSALTYLQIGENVTVISSNAFGNCSSLQEIEVYPLIPPAAVSLSFDENTYKAARLKVPYFSNGEYRKTAPWNKFSLIEESLNTPLTSFIINNIKYSIIEDAEVPSVEVIENEETPYSGSIYIPATIQYIGETYKVTGITTNAFRDNFNITYIEMGDNISSIGEYAFSGCDAMNSIKLSKSLTELPKGCFQSCLSLNTFTVPGNISYIDDRCFLGCYNLTDITFESGLKGLGNEVFIGCPSLSSITSGAINPPTAPFNVFNPSVYESATLLVKNQSIEAYSTTYPWSEFNNISDYDFIPIQTISIWQDEISLNAGSSFKPTISVSPRDYTVTDLAWKTSNPSIATVDQTGNITGVREGIAFVAAYSISNPEIFAECLVEVTDNGNGIESFKAQGITLKSKDGLIYIINKPARVKCQIFNIAGNLIKETEDEVISGLPHGIYLLRIGNSSIKIIL